jgi:HEAT repeat protein
LQLQRARTKQAMEAVRQIGTNGIPCLLELLRSKDSVPKLMLEALLRRQSLIKLHFRTASERQDQALAAFHELGSRAKSAIPDLAAMLDEDEQIAGGALRALRFLDCREAALPLAKALTNDNPRLRRDAALNLQVLSWDAKDALPALMKTAKEDKDPEVRRFATFAFSRIGGEPTVVLPLVIEKLSDSDPGVRTVAAQLIGEFGAHAKAAIPALLKTIQDESSTARNNAIHALNRIDHEAAEKAGVARQLSPNYE